MTPYQTTMYINRYRQGHRCGSESGFSELVASCPIISGTPSAMHSSLNGPPNPPTLSDCGEEAETIRGCCDSTRPLAVSSGVGARSGFIHSVGGSLTEKFSILVQKKEEKNTFQRIKKF